MNSIVQCVNTMDIGGLEQLVLTLALALRQESFNSSICCIEERGALADQAEAAGVAVHALNMSRTGKLAAMHSFCAFLRQRRPVVIHSHNFKPFYYSAWARVLGAAQGHVYTRHGTFSKHQQGRWRSRLLRSGVDHFVAVSLDAQAQLSQLTGVPSDRIHIVANGVDTTRFQPIADKAFRRRELGLPDAALSIMTVARLSPEKDLVTMLEAFKLLLDQWKPSSNQPFPVSSLKSPSPSSLIPSPTLLIVGDGPCLTELKNEAARLGISSRVNFLGERMDVDQLLPSTDIFTLSSISEGLSVAMLEAAACGVPIVATDVGANRKVVNPPECGRIVPVRDARALADAFLELLSDGGQRDTVRIAARNQAVNEYSVGKMVEQYAALYGNVQNKSVKHS